MRKMITTRKKVKVVGQQEYINPRTGEPEMFNVVNIEERDANFHKIWLGHIIQALDVIGNQKIKVLTFILDNLDKENRLIMTQRKLAEKADVSINTVTDTLKALQDADFLIKIHSGAYQVNPDVLFKGGKSNRLRVLLDYGSATSEAAATIKKTTAATTLEQLEAEGQEVLFDAQQAAQEVTAASEELVADQEPPKAKPTCLICGNVLIERTRREDGKKFMGCPNYKDANHNVGRKYA